MADNPLPVEEPGLADPARDSVAGGYKDAWAKNTQHNKARASENTKDVMTWGMNYDPKALNKNQNAQYPKDGGQFGRINNRDYSTTLRMARKAQAYNSMPRAEGQIVGPNGYVHNAGYGYEKPQMNTYEQQAMNQSMQLDANQKMLAQQLQAAVNGKNYDLFKQTWQQLTGIELTDYQVQNMITQMLRSRQMLDTFNRNAQLWQRKFGMWDTADKLYILNNTYPGNPMLAPLYAMWGFGAAPNLEDMAAMQYYQSMWNNPQFAGMDDVLKNKIIQAKYNANTARTEKQDRKSDQGKFNADAYTAAYNKGKSNAAG